MSLILEGLLSRCLSNMSKSMHCNSFLEDLNLRNFHGIYRFLPVLTEILVKTSFFSFYTAFYAPFWVKNCVLSNGREKCDRIPYLLNIYLMIY